MSHLLEPFFSFVLLFRGEQTKRYKKNKYNYIGILCKLGKDLPESKHVIRRSQAFILQ